MLCTDACVHFLDHCRTAKRLSEHTLRAYESDLRDFRTFLGAGIAVDEINRERLKGFVRLLFERHLKESSVKRRLATLKGFFRWLEQEEEIPLTPFHRLDLTVRLPHRLPRALSAEEMRNLLRRAEMEANDGGFSRILIRFVIVSLFATGLRVSELTSVRLEHVAPEEGLIQVRGKGNRERRVYLPGREAQTVLIHYLEARSRLMVASPLLLTTAAGAEITPQHIRRHLGSLAHRASIIRRVTPHMLRHTAATQLIEAGVDIRFVQKLLGHASIATTQIYTQVSDTSLRATLERANTLQKLA